MENQAYLQINNICKSFFGVPILKNVSISIDAGEIHGLLGGNGAGKSTLMNVLGGIYTKDSGDIFIDGAKTNIRNASDAEKAGISFIHQELKLFGLRSVAENIEISNLPTSGPFGFVDEKKKNSDAQKWLDMVGLNVKSKVRLGELSIAQQQLVEIAKALSLNAKIMIFDEPTSSLTAHETQKLFEIIRGFKREGRCIIYISHKFDEIFQICDRVTVLRNGENAGTLDVKNATSDELIRMIIGRKLNQYFPELPPAPGENTPAVLEVKGLENNRLNGMSFDLKKGEILGLFGLVGAGKSETVRAIFGIDKLSGGEIAVNGQKVKRMTPKRAMKLGLSFLTENRREEGLVMKLDIRHNLTIPIISRLSVPVVKCVKLREESRTVDSAFARFMIKATGPKQRVSTLSGGNQQKVVLSKWIMTNPDVLILDEPTRGVDVGAKAEIYQLIVEMVREGLSVIIISCEEDEILEMCHRILVVNEGRVVGSFAQKEATTEKMLKLCMAGDEV
ncbi:MAG: sugar ABC transporter ATP-binding protein [Hungatella sp.]|nr:sugar ABC transporter ATP-binding protein [Hungatella sp.]